MSKIEAFWARFKEHTQQPNAKYLSDFHFELNEKLANELLELVLIGQKKATSSSLNAYILENEPLPKEGDLHIVTDFYGNPRCVIKTTAITILPFNEMTYDICKREGEDDTLESWQKGHIRFFKEEAKAKNASFSMDMPIVFEDFEVVYQE